MTYNYERPDLKAVSELEELFQHLGAEVAAWRRRSLKAEGELQEIRAKGGVYEGPELSGVRQRVVELETENQALRERIDAAKERVRSLAARLAFLEQGGTAS
jgi:chromosome segregation ATPase